MAQPAGAAAFLRVQGVDAEPRVGVPAAYLKWIGLTGYEFAQRRSRGEHVDLLKVTKRCDATSGRLLLLCSRGEEIPEVTLDVVRAGGKSVRRILRVVLTKADIANIEASETGSEVLSLNAVEFSVTYGD